MATPAWKISGDYFEACSCDSVCPCPTSGLAARPTQGYCNAGLVFHVERGSFGATALDDLNFAVLLHTPGPMISRPVSRHGSWPRSGRPAHACPMHRPETKATSESTVTSLR